MPGAAGAADHAMEQALLAQLPPHTYLDAWRCKNAPAVSVGPPPPPAPETTAAAAPSPAQAETNGASPAAVPAHVGTSSVAAADEPVQTAQAKQAARPKPVPPPRSSEQRKAALALARQQNIELAGLRAGLQARQLTLAELHNGVDIRALAAYLGHHDPGFTLRTYVHLMPSADDRMRQAINAVFASSDGPETARQGVR